MGTFSGRAMYAGYYRHVAFMGLCPQIIGVSRTSLVKQFWQLVLAQGLCQGLGNGLVFTPTVTLSNVFFIFSMNAERNVGDFLIGNL